MPIYDITPHIRTRTITPSSISNGVKNIIAPASNWVGDDWSPNSSSHFKIFSYQTPGINCVTTIFEFTNNCQYPVWVGTLSGAGTPALNQTGFQLKEGSSVDLSAPRSWSGRFWGRTGCSTDSDTGKFSCETADCGTDSIACDGHGPTPPASLVEITLGGGTSNDYYDVSLVDGFNIPISIEPVDGTGDCRATACSENLNTDCPDDLKVIASNDTIVGCKSSCDALKEARYCCTGDYGSPSTCGPSKYSQVFKEACPSAYSYAYDDAMLLPFALDPV